MESDREQLLRSKARAFFGGSEYRQISAEKLGDRLGVKRRERGDFVELLYQLEEAGLAVHVEGLGWCAPHREGWMVGCIKVNRRGFAFVRPALEDAEEDVFIPPRKLKDAHSGDLVLVRLQKSRPGAARKGKRRNASEDRGPSGRVLHVLRRSHRVIIGTYHAAGRGAGTVEPHAHESVREIFIAKGKGAAATDGDRVLARLVEGPSVGGLPPGVVIEVAEEEGSWRADVQMVIAEYQLRETFPSEVLREARKIGDVVPAEEISRRVDRRDVTIFTIDPRDAKDFDDAITIEQTDEGTTWLGVFIADVSFYVRPGTELDREAYQRGNSVYLPGKTIPMLPEQLSNGLCSLRPDEDRLAMGVWMEFSSTGELISEEVESAVIRSCRRFTYGEVQEILDGEDADAGEEHLQEMILEMEALRKTLSRRKEDRGAIELDLVEQRLILDEDGEVLSVEGRPRDAAHKLVEEFMLAANETVARIATKRKIWIMRRIHQAPPEEDIELFTKFCRALVPQVRVRDINDFPKLVEQVRGTAVAPIVNLALLRTLTQAEYSPHKALHYALALDEYCHFTSPIRRYPDLQVHRALFGKTAASPRQLGEAPPDLERTAAHCSTAERTAEDAERDMKQRRAISWLQHRIGEQFDGLITAILDFGFFVRLDGCLIEGLVHITSMRDDVYVLSESAFSLRGRNKGRVLQLGDPIEVLLKDADPLHRQVDLKYLRHRRF